MRDHNYGKVMHELGSLGVSWTSAGTLLAEAAKRGGARVNQIGAKGYVDILGTGKVLVYDSGTGGEGYFWSIEEKPLSANDVINAGIKAWTQAEVDGDMVMDDWVVQARRYLTSQPHKVTYLDGTNNYRCTCGTVFTVDHGYAWCPNSPQNPKNASKP